FIMIYTAETKGLNGTQLKILALIFMTLDHIYHYLNGVVYIPVLFTVIGRLAAPMFFFMVCEGFEQTSNRRKYALRLYLFSVVMGVINILKGIYIPHPQGYISEGNIFATLFLVVFILMCIESIKSNASRDRAFGILGLVLVGAVQIGVMYTPLGLFASTLLPTPLYVEGTVIFVFFGVALYYMRNDRLTLSVYYIAFSMIFLISAVQSGLTVENLLSNCQWAMVFALPFMLSYSGQRGRGMKYLFYLYYPIHKVVLTIIAVIFAA
ncbi:MAG: conjugal transfer protein TraX, partial [Clostridiales bacterium]|nr:conjugal transfer protein TraX [Clostridiales bacterium]